MIGYTENTNDEEKWLHKIEYDFIFEINSLSNGHIIQQ